jgi:hypothetical protein
MNNYQFTILLSASVPSDKRDPKYTKIKNAQTQIEEAVIGLSRNIFQAGGKIIFGGHPTISPLVEMVATEYPIKREIENFERNSIKDKPINIYQSKAYENEIPKQTKNLFDLGYSEIVWTEAKNGEKYNSQIKGVPQCKNSLEFMRKEMMSEKIDALVCIGGMEGVETEFNLFREIHPDKPIFILRSTGGACAILAEEYSNLDVVKIIDKKYTHIKKGEDIEKFDIIPYSFITALIVKEVQEKKQ